MFEQEIVLSFFPGFEWVAATTAGWLFDKFRDKPEERAHKRQLSSEDMRHQASLDHDRQMAEARREEYRNYIREERAREDAFRQRKMESLRNSGFGGLAGVGGVDLGILADSGGGGGVPGPSSPGYSGGRRGLMPVTTQGMPRFPAPVSPASLIELAKEIGMSSGGNPAGMIPSTRLPPVSTPNPPGQPGYRPGTGRGYA